MVSSKQFSSALHARRAAEILLELHELGATWTDLQRCKTQGVFWGVRTGKDPADGGKPKRKRRTQGTEEHTEMENVQRKPASKCKAKGKAKMSETGQAGEGS